MSNSTNNQNEPIMTAEELGSMSSAMRTSSAAFYDAYESTLRVELALGTNKLEASVKVKGDGTLC